MKFFQTIILVFLLFILFSNTVFSDLTVDEQYKILKSQVVENLKSENYQKIIDLIEKISELNVSIEDSDSIHYFEGLALVKTGDSTKGRDKLTLYINNAGQNGHFYKEATNLIFEMDIKKKIEDEKAQIKARLLEIEKRKTQTLAAIVEKVGMVIGKGQVNDTEFKIRISQNIDVRDSGSVKIAILYTEPDRTKGGKKETRVKIIDFDKIIAVDAINFAENKIAAVACSTKKIKSLPKTPREGVKYRNSFFFQTYKTALLVKSKIEEMITLSKEEFKFIQSYFRLMCDELKVYRITFEDGQKWDVGAYLQLGENTYFTWWKCKHLKQQKRKTALIKNIVDLNLFCEKGDFKKCTDLGHVYLSRKKIELGIEFLIKACDGEEYKGCNNLGWLYKNGYGVEKDYTKAKDLYQKACDGGNLSGCTNLGTLYKNALGVEQNYKLARTLYQRACDGEEFTGCANLGGLYENGLGVKQDSTKAWQLFKKACDGGNKIACKKIEDLVNQMKAKDQFQKSCDQGNIEDCGNLAWFYENGQGVEKDYVKARELYQKACDGGYQKACEHIKAMIVQ